MTIIMTGADDLARARLLRRGFLLEYVTLGWNVGGGRTVLSRTRIPRMWCDGFSAWTLGAVTTILRNPRYTGRQVWNRQRTGKDLADPANTSMGHKGVQRWNLPDGWVISEKPAHPALASEADFIAAQGISAARGPAPKDAPVVLEKRRYQLAGLLACGMCGRRMESARSNGKPAYRCRHGYTSAMPPDPDRPKNAYIREDRLLPRLPRLYLLLAGTGSAGEPRRVAPKSGPSFTAAG